MILKEICNERDLRDSRGCLSAQFISQLSVIIAAKWKRFSFPFQHALNYRRFEEHLEKHRVTGERCMHYDR